MFPFPFFCCWELSGVDLISSSEYTYKNHAKIVFHLPFSLAFDILTFFLGNEPIYKGIYVALKAFDVNTYNHVKYITFMG